MKDFNEALKLDSVLANAYFNKGRVYRVWKKYDSALVEFNRAIKLDPDFANAYYSRSLVERKMNDTTAARKDMDWYNNWRDKRNTNSSSLK